MNWSPWEMPCQIFICNSVLMPSQTVIWKLLHILSLWFIPLTSRIQFVDIEQPETVWRRVPFKKLRLLRYNAICAQGVAKLLSSFLFIKTEIFIWAIIIAAYFRVCVLWNWSLMQLDNIDSFYCNYVNNTKFSSPFIFHFHVHVKRGLESE